MKTLSALRIAARFFRAVSYVFTTFLWFWLAILLLPALLDSGMLEMLAPKGAEPEPSAQSGPVSPILLVIGGVVTILMIVLTIVALLRLPKMMVKTTGTVTHKVADAVVPIVLHHKPANKKKQKAVSEKVLFYVRACLILLPFAGTYFTPQIKDAEPTIGIMVGGILALIATVSLAIELALTLASSKKKSAKQK